MGDPQPSATAAGLAARATRAVQRLNGGGSALSYCLGHVSLLVTKMYQLLLVTNPLLASLERLLMALFLLDYSKLAPHTCTLSFRDQS